MAEHEKKEKEEVTDEVLKTVGKILPGFGSFFKKAEKTKKFGPRMTKIREEIERRFGKLKNKGPKEG